MFKKVTKIALAGVIGVGTLVGANSLASAAKAADYNTKANIIFTENNETTNPVDPENPGEEVTPEKDPDGDDPIAPGTEGPLSIDYASHINFGEVMISGNAETYYANPVVVTKGDEKLERAPYVQITDNRGTKAGWDLQVTQEAEFTNGESELTGSKLSLKDPIHNSMNSDAGINNQDIVFENKGQAYPVMDAEAGNGAGTHTNRFGEIVGGKATSVSLEVPGDLEIVEGKYTTDLKWELLDTPK